MKLSTLQKGLVGHWPLDQQSYNPATKRFTDKTPFSNQGTGNGTQLGGAPTFQTDWMGQANRATPFNGDDDYIDLGSITSGYPLMLNGSDVTISAWVKQQSGGDDYQRIIDKSDSGIAANGYALLMSPTDRVVTVVVDTVNYITDDTNVYEFDTWTHVVGIITATGGKIYLNGQEESGTGAIGQPPDVATNMRIGTWNHDVAREFDGNMADLRIYNRALSPEEITALYESYRPQLNMGSLMKGLVLDMPLNSKRYNAGTGKFDDLTPYENRGTNNGAAVGSLYSTFVASESDYIRISDNDSLDITPAMSAFIWLKKDTLANSAALTKYDSGIDKRSWRINSSNSSPYKVLRITISDNGTFDANHLKDYFSSIDVFDNTWHYTGFTFNAGVLKLYIDGIEDTSVVKTEDDAITTIFTSDCDVIIGATLSTNTPLLFYDGDIAKASIYNRALTPEEILLLFDSQKGKFL